MTKSTASWDIFCKVVDNFGDIGIAWRLAQQLHHEHNLAIRLFVDDLATTAKVLHDIHNVAEQVYDGITIVRWDHRTTFTNVNDTVIETFACGLPADYLSLMTKQTVWVNVDHLSAEYWVPEFHALNGQHQPTNLTRHFFFPGFNDATGGLLREQTLTQRRDAFLQDASQQQTFWTALGLHETNNDLKVSVFSYASAPVAAYLQTLAAGNQSVSVYMPMNSHLPSSLLGYADIAVGDCLQAGNVTVHILPFLSQQLYDRLLWTCDINFVRGEDSWVRAVWAGKPFIWQPYWQEDDAHLLKLSAFIQSFYTHPDLDQAIIQLHQLWATERFQAEVWQTYTAQLTEIAEHTKQQSNLLIQQEDLATKLRAFCANAAK